MITDIEDYFSKGCGRCERFDTPDCSVRQWLPGVKKLREICLSSGLTEQVKWGHPCYIDEGRNIAIIGAFRKDFRLSFFNAALMKDPENVLKKQGPNTEHPDMLTFQSEAAVIDMASIIGSYLGEAMEYARAGIKPIKSTGNLLLPEELIDAMDADSELAEAFHKLTPGRQKSYVIYLNSAKKSDTRIARIIKFREKILLGKGATER